MYIFALDGTITDSNGLWGRVDEMFLGRRGLAATAEYMETVGRSIFPVAAEFTRRYYGLPDSPADIMDEWAGLARGLYEREVELKAGASELLERCRAAGREMAIFTACRPELCRIVLERFGLGPYFRHVVYAEEIGLEKHDPRCFARLSELLGAPPEDCVLFDDSPYNCATARASGYRTVGVYDAFYTHRQEQLRRASTRYVRGLEELLTGPLP